MEDPLILQKRIHKCLQRTRSFKFYERRNPVFAITKQSYGIGQQSKYENNAGFTFIVGVYQGIVLWPSFGWA